jgi:hypothetical protein
MPEGQAWWLMPIIPATWEVEIKRIIVHDYFRQKTRETPSQQVSWACDPYL